MTAKTDGELLTDISRKLDRLIMLMATNGRSQDEQIAALVSLEYDWKTIGQIVQLKPDAARKRFERRRSTKQDA